MAEMTEKQWLSGVQSSIIKELTTHKAALPAGFNQERFALNTVTVISEMLKDKKKKTELCKLTFESMAVCLCKAAYLGLDYFNGECYAIPYGGELNFQTDYKGEIKMCKRFSRNPIKDIFAKVVRQDDFFTEEVDAGVQNVIYRPQPFSNKPMIGAFAIVVFKDGSMMYDTMSVGGGSGSTTIGSTATEMFAYSSISDFLSLNDNLLAEAIRNGATGYNGFTEGTESDSDTADEPLSSSSTVETGKTNINLNIQMSPQFNISDSGTGKMDEASIMAIIRKNMKSMADELGGEIADRLEQVFSNMPVVKEG